MFKRSFTFRERAELTEITDPLVKLGHQWQTTESQISALGGSGADASAACDHIDLIERQIATAVPTTLHGVLVQIRLLKALRCWSMSYGGHAEAVRDKLLDNLTVGIAAMIQDIQLAAT